MSKLVVTEALFPLEKVYTGKKLIHSFIHLKFKSSIDFSRNETKNAINSSMIQKEYTLKHIRCKNGYT